MRRAHDVKEIVLFSFLYAFITFIFSSDIRPVSPQEEGKPSHTEGCGQGGGVSPRNSERQNKAVIHTGDPDLLLRLFDTVEPQTRFTGTRVRRGRLVY